MRTLLLIMTVVGGLLSLTAAGWVGWLAWRARWRQRNLARLGDLYVEELKRHSRAYQDYGNRLAEHEAGRSPRPVPPFGGMDQKAHEDQVHAEHFERLRKRTGREPLQPGTDRKVGGELLAELIGPAVVGGVGAGLRLYESPQGCCAEFGTKRSHWATCSSRQQQRQTGSLRH